MTLGDFWSVVAVDAWGVGRKVDWAEKETSKEDSDWGPGAASKEDVVLEEASGAGVTGDSTVGEGCRRFLGWFATEFCSGIIAELPSSTLLFGGRPRIFLTGGLGEVIGGFSPWEIVSPPSSLSLIDLNSVPFDVDWSLCSCPLTRTFRWCRPVLKSSNTSSRANFLNSDLHSGLSFSKNTSSRATKLSQSSFFSTSVAFKPLPSFPKRSEIDIPVHTWISSIYITVFFEEDQEISRDLSPTWPPQRRPRKRKIKRFVWIAKYRCTPKSYIPARVTSRTSQKAPLASPSLRTPKLLMLILWYQKILELTIVTSLPQLAQHPRDQSLSSLSHIKKILSIISVIRLMETRYGDEYRWLVRLMLRLWCR
jgi:hypothetical protein